MGGLWARVLLLGLAGAAPRGQQPRLRCGLAVRYVPRPRQAELRSGARPGRLRRCSALSLWAAWAADLQAFLLAPLALTVAAGVQAVCASAAPRWVTGIDHVDSVAPLLSVLGGLRGLVVVLGRGWRQWLLVWSLGGRRRLCVWRRNALALRVSWLSYARSVRLLADGALKSPAARPRDTRALPCSAATHTHSVRGSIWGKCEAEGG